MLMRYPQMMVDNRLASSFNPSVLVNGELWISNGYYGLDQGIVVMMIENHRSGLLWQLMRGCSYIRDGLQQAGFTGGWLQPSDTDGAR
jgi:hypothetical protein